jgi:hypothetical protein
MLERVDIKTSPFRGRESKKTNCKKARWKTRKNNSHAIRHETERNYLDWNIICVRCLKTHKSEFFCWNMNFVCALSKSALALIIPILFPVFLCLWKYTMKNNIFSSVLCVMKTMEWIHKLDFSMDAERECAVMESLLKLIMKCGMFCCVFWYMKMLD